MSEPDSHRSKKLRAGSLLATRDANLKSDSKAVRAGDRTKPNQRARETENVPKQSNINTAQLRGSNGASENITSSGVNRAEFATYRATMSSCQPAHRGNQQVGLSASSGEVKHKYRRESGPNVIGRTVGTVKWFDANKGFGFIVGPNGEEVFAHYSVIVGNGYRALRDGSNVMFEAVRANDGWRATWIDRQSQECKLAYPRTPRQGSSIRGGNRIPRRDPDQK